MLAALLSSVCAPRGREPRCSAEVYIDASCRGGTRVELRMPSTGDALSGGNPY